MRARVSRFDSGMAIFMERSFLAGHFRLHPTQNPKCTNFLVNEDGRGVAA